MRGETRLIAKCLDLGDELREGFSKAIEHGPRILLILELLSVFYSARP